MPTLHVTASIPGSLYVNGGSPARLPDEIAKAEVSATGTHLLFVPYEDGYFPFSRYITPEADAAWRGMNAIFWPGGTIEAHIRPLPAEPARVIATAPFMGGAATLFESDMIRVETPDGQVFAVGDGREGGLHPLPNGVLAAFATDRKGEALLALSCGEDGGPRVILHAKGIRTLMAEDGRRVRVLEKSPQGNSSESEREYEYDPHRGTFIQKNARIASILDPAETPKRMIAAVTAGSIDEALGLLTPSLREVVDGAKLIAFLGEFDECVEARHIPTTSGIYTLALLRSQGEVHQARILAFEVVRREGSCLIDNVRAWE